MQSAARRIPTPARRGQDLIQASQLLFNVVLFEPEIPPNTGNIIRLCANTGTALHLIEPLGFTLEDRLLRRAGLDYHEWASVQVHRNYAAFLQQVAPARIFAYSTKGRMDFHVPQYRAGDTLLFGPETRGLPAELICASEIVQVVRIPMRPGVRSLNLSNAVAIAVYEAWRQTGYRDGA
jgi:tRNA (cytidine/uridine-2'-O-)-methyltransferase